jgi:quercetin dioxygenase-like cupin family protein
MDRAAFEAGLKRDGFTPAERSMKAGTVNPDHTHPFDARLLILSGQITITRNGTPETFAAGDSCSVDANTVHAEEVGAEDVVYIAGRRAP